MTTAGWIVAGYPLALRLLPARKWRQAEACPAVTILIPAYRERDLLRSKLRELHKLDYPSEQLQVLVVADGDRELARIAESEYPEATVLALPSRRGKAAALNHALGSVRGEIVVLTNVHSPLQKDSLKAAMPHFGDEAIWAVGGRCGEIESAYDAYEDVVRRLECRSGSVASVYGGFIAVRRERLTPFPEDVVNDDLWLLCRLVREGGRVIYEPGAWAGEATLDVRAELARRSRIGAGRVLLLSELRGLPLGFAWRLVSHKFGRLLLPFLMVGGLISSLSLVRRPLYRYLAGAQAAFYATGVLAAAGFNPGGRPGIVTRLARQVVVGNTAVAVGVVRGLRRRQDVRWSPVR